MPRWFDAAKRHPSAVLLAVQLIGVVVYPFMGDSPAGRAALSLFSVLVLGLAVLALRPTPALNWVAALLGLPVLALTVLEALDPGPITLLWSALLHGAFYFYTTHGLIRYMFTDRRVTTDELFATGATFTVMAWGFAYLYVAVQMIWPGSFVAAIDPALPRTWMELLFLSFTTLTSTGLSDVLPVLPHARALVMIEQVAGLMYVALVIARLVGLAAGRS